MSKNKFVNEIEYDPDEILSHEGAGDVIFKLVAGKEVVVNMNDDRYTNFKSHGTTCVACGIRGTHFRLEYNSMFGYHFNLYHKRKNGTLTMLTKDHVIPRSKGGADHNDNYQPMCAPCNMRKGNKMPDRNNKLCKHTTKMRTERVDGDFIITESRCVACGEIMERHVVGK